MRREVCALVVLLQAMCPFVLAQETHDHPAPERLGKVSFATSCKPSVQDSFNRAVALLHSFAYREAEKAFLEVASRDSGCAMAYWGAAMSNFHQLWEPSVSPSGFTAGRKEIEQAQQANAKNERERGYISAAAIMFEDSNVPSRKKLPDYEIAMKQVAQKNPADTEAQIFYALALIANAPPTDKTHAKQKQAAKILEPLYKRYPQHPGLAHFLIHGYDNAELAKRALPAAREYSKIAPSAPHALHMPSHIFTRLGLWDDSIASNLAAKKAAHEQGDVGEELHAMDYLVYAYLQSGRDDDAANILHELKEMKLDRAEEFKVGYAATAMPIRYAVERNKWSDAAQIVPTQGLAPHVEAIAVWARGIGLARTGIPVEASRSVEKLRELGAKLETSGNEYWATQTRVLMLEVMAWTADAQGNKDEAVKLLREAADKEDSIEKLPVTPGPIIPAREQLGELLLEQKQPKLAQVEFARALAESPGRRRAMQAAKLAAQR